MPDVFLSYNREDEASARRFAEALCADGFDVWWDRVLRSGENYDEVTEQALRAAKAVVVLWSKRSVVSRWVRAEATLADRKKTLVPALIEPCERPIMFELTQTADLAHWEGKLDDPVWRSFAADVRRMTEASTPSTLVPTAQIPTGLGLSSRPGRKPSLAVLPFTNRSGLREDDIFASGMVEDCIAALSLSRGVKVIASSATAAYRREAIDLRAIGRDLGADYILEGNVRRAGSDLRVTSQLVEPETGKILWTQKFDRPLHELARLQEDLVTEVAGHLGVQVQRIEMERALKKPGDLSAWESVLRSTSAYARVNLESARFSVAEARSAVAKAPEYGVAHAALALAVANLFAWSGGDNSIGVREAGAHMERAMNLDPSNPSVLWMGGWALDLLGQPKEALPYAQAAVEQNPNIAAARTALGLTYYFLHRPDEAIIQFDAADKLAPRGYLLYLSLSYRSFAHLQAGRIGPSFAAIERSLQLNPNHPGSLLHLALLSLMAGAPEGAREALRRLRSYEPNLPLETHLKRARILFSPPPAAEVVAAVRTMWVQAVDA